MADRPRAEIQGNASADQRVRIAVVTRLAGLARTHVQELSFGPGDLPRSLEHRALERGLVHPTLPHRKPDAAVAVMGGSAERGHARVDALRFVLSQPKVPSAWRCGGLRGQRAAVRRGSRE
jgi:hypothetical protein